MVLIFEKARLWDSEILRLENVILMGLQYHHPTVFLLNWRIAQRSLRLAGCPMAESIELSVPKIARRFL